jgi:hypothetical protein
MSERRQIDLHATVTTRLARMTVTTTFHGQQELVLTRKVDRLLHVYGASRLHDQGRIFIKTLVQQQPGFVVTVIAWQQQIAAQAIGQLLHRGLRHDDFGTGSTDSDDIAVRGGQGLQRSVDL